MIGSAIACLERFVATFFVARLESVLLTTVFDALMSYRNRDVHVSFQCAGPVGAPRASARLNHKHRSFFALELWGTWCCIVTGHQ